MKHGLYFRGLHSSQFNATIKSIRELYPQKRKREATALGKHGVYEFTDNTYEKRLIEVDISLQNKSNMYALRLLARDVAAWLSERGELTFDDEPDKYYIATVFDKSSLETISSVCGIFPIVFECQPFALFQISTKEDLTWDTLLPWYTDCKWDNAVDYSVTVTSSPSALDINYMGNIELGLGSQPGAKFDIIITGSFTNISIMLNGKTINYTESISNEAVKIDNINAKVTKGSINKLSVCTGDLEEFLKLVPGINTIDITGTDLNCTVLFDYIAQYI